MSAHRTRRSSIPPIPDMRFETAYLAKLRPYIHITRLRGPSDDFDIVYDEKHAEKKHGREVITIEWGNVIWATFRDQVLATGLQGAVWTLVSFYLSPVYGKFSERVGKKLKTGEGSAAAYLRGWVHQLGLSGARQR